MQASPTRKVRCRLFAVIVGLSSWVPQGFAAEEAQDSQESSPSVGLFRLPAHRGSADALAGPEGFGFLSRDNNFGMLIHWILQADARAELGDLVNASQRDTFQVRYAGLALTARFYEVVRSELLVNFAGTQVSLSEAWVDAQVTPWLHVKAGRFHYPISLERITTGIFFPLVDASLPSALLASADTGLQAWGRVDNGLLEYNLALVNGAVAGSTVDPDVDQFKDFVGRVLAQPFLHCDAAFVRFLAVGVGASYGRHEGTVASPELPRLTTWGGFPFFAFQNSGTAGGTAVATGDSGRLVPQLSWHCGPVSGYSEFVWGFDQVNNSRVTYEAVGAVATVVLTGEPSTPLHYVVPARPFAPSEGRFGAIELTGSAGGLRVDPGLAVGSISTNSGTSLTKTFAAGLNWYPFLAVRVMIDGSCSIFEPLPGAAAIQNELLLVGRFQVVL